MANGSAFKKPKVIKADSQSLKESLDEIMGAYSPHFFYSPRKSCAK
jgi:hypothetical protein